MTRCRSHPRFRTSRPPRPRLPRPSQRPRLPRLHRSVRALLLLFHADAAHALHGQLPAAAPGHIEKVAGLAWLRAWHYPGLDGQPLSSAIFGDYTVAGLSDADPRRDHRRQADSGRRIALIAGGAGDGARPFPDGVRRRVPVRAAGADRRRRPVQGQYRDPGRRALRRKRPAPRDGVPDLLHLHQRQRDRRAADLGHARPESRLALRLWLRRGGDGARPDHLSVGQNGCRPTSRSPTATASS